MKAHKVSATYYDGWEIPGTKNHFYVYQLTCSLLHLLLPVLFPRKLLVLKLRYIFLSQVYSVLDF